MMILTYDYGLAEDSRCVRGLLRDICIESFYDFVTLFVCSVRDKLYRFDVYCCVCSFDCVPRTVERLGVICARQTTCYYAKRSPYYSYKEDIDRRYAYRRGEKGDDGFVILNSILFIYCAIERRVTYISNIL